MYRYCGIRMNVSRPTGAGMEERMNGPEVDLNLLPFYVQWCFNLLNLEKYNGPLKMYRYCGIHVYVLRPTGAGMEERIKGPEADLNLLPIYVQWCFNLLNLEKFNGPVKTCIDVCDICDICDDVSRPTEVRMEESTGGAEADLTFSPTFV